MRVCRILSATMVLLAAMSLAVGEPTYVGAKKCKLCHKTEFASWESLGHAKAFERLSAEEQSDAN